MSKNSTIVLDIKPYTKVYNFFSFVIAVNKIMLFDPEYNLFVTQPDENMKHQLQKQYEALKDKFLFMGNAKEPSGKISFIQTEYLLNFTELIAKALQQQNAERFVQVIAE